MFPGFTLIEKLCCGVRVWIGSIEHPLQVDDAESAMWTIPAARSKNGKAHVVPLSGTALSIVVDLIKRATALAGEHPPPQFLFVSPNDPKKPIDRHAFLGSDDPIRKCAERWC
jgi:hypothetical protein